MFPEISTNFSKLGRFYSECLLKHAAIVAIFKRVQLEKKHHFSQIHFKPWSFIGGIPLSCSQKYPIALPQMSGATCHHSSGFASHFGWSELAMKKSILSRIPTWKKKTHIKPRNPKFSASNFKGKKPSWWRFQWSFFTRKRAIFGPSISCLEDGGESDGNFDERLRNAKNLLLGWGSRQISHGWVEATSWVHIWLVCFSPSHLKNMGQVKLDHFPKGWKEK